VFGAILLPVMLAAYHSRYQPPSIGTVKSLMDEEVTAGMIHDVDLVNHIYTSDASVTDAACQTAGASRTWKGHDQLDARYRSLPTFLSLQHVFAQVTWDPNDSYASTAYVRAETIGVILPAVGHGKSQSIVGHELWVFTRGNGQWKISSFTYNLCLPANGAG
jgi:hypothetical protein